MTIKISTEDLRELQAAALENGACLYKTQTDDGEPVWLKIEAPAARKPRQRRTTATNAEPDATPNGGSGPVEAAYQRMQNTAADQ